MLLALRACPENDESTRKRVSTLRLREEAYESVSFDARSELANAMCVLMPQLAIQELEPARSADRYFGHVLGGGIF